MTGSVLDRTRSEKSEGVGVFREEATRATERWDAQSGPSASAEPPRARNLLGRGYASLPDLRITRLLTRVPLIKSRPDR